MLVQNSISTNQKKCKILLYGNIQAAHYRCQSLIKLLLYSRYFISFVSPNFYCDTQRISNSFVNKILSRIHLLELIIKSVFTDVIYILPCNNHLIENAITVSKIFKKKLIVENHVSLYDNLLEERGKYNEGLQKAAKEMRRDKLALCQPDYIINTSNHEPTYWEKKLGIKIDQNKVFIAPLFGSSRLVHQKIFMQDGILKICWWGSFLPLHGLENIIEAMKLLKEREVKFTCNLFGINNSEYNVYAEKIRIAQLDSSVFLRKDLTFYDDSLPRYLVENCDLALGIFGNTDKAHNTFPTKLVESLSMGIPTLTMNSLALQEFLNPETDLWTCETSPEAIADSIFTIANGAAYPVDWEQTRLKVLDTFSVNRYQEVISKVLERVTNDLSGREISDVQSSLKIYEQKIS